MKDSSGGVRALFGHISSLEAAALIFVQVTTKAFLAFPGKLAALAHTAAWAVPAVSGLLSGLLWVWPLTIVLKRHPGKNLVEITRHLAGNALALITGILLFGYNVGVIVVEAREIVASVITVVMPNTPHAFLVAVGFPALAYMASQGMEVLGRTCVLVGLGVLTAVIFLSALSANKWNTDSVFPLLGPGVKEMAKICGIRQVTYGELLNVGMVALYLRRKDEAGKVAGWALGISTALLTLVVFTCQMIFVHPSLAGIPIPFLRVTRIIRVGRFFHRFDALFVPVWLSAGLLSSSVRLIVAALALSSALPVSEAKRQSSVHPILWATAALCLGLTLSVPTFAQSIILEADVIRPYSLPLLVGWPLLLLVLSQLRGKKQNGSEDG